MGNIIAVPLLKAIGLGAAGAKTVAAVGTGINLVGGTLAAKQVAKSLALKPPAPVESPKAEINEAPTRVSTAPTVVSVGEQGRSGGQSRADLLSTILAGDPMRKKNKLG